MCYICGDLEIQDTNHLEKVVHHLPDYELDDVVLSLKRQLKNIQSFPIDDSLTDKTLLKDAIKSLRMTVLVALNEKYKRNKV